MHGQASKRDANRQRHQQPPEVLVQDNATAARHADRTQSYRRALPSLSSSPLRPWGIVALVCALTILTRQPFLTPRLAHWDAVNYALGLHDFNVAAHQPHPPGSPYYILLGRAVLALSGDDNGALIAIS